MTHHTGELGLYTQVRSLEKRKMVNGSPPIPTASANPSRRLFLAGDKTGPGDSEAVLGTNHRLVGTRPHGIDCDKKKRESCWLLRSVGLLMSLSMRQQLPRA